MIFGADNLFKQLRDVLLAKPLYFAIDTIETPWQKKWVGKLDRNLAIKQHENMCSALEAEGIKCHFLSPVKGVPIQKDSRDVGIISSKGAIVARQKHIDVKKGEAEAFIKFCNKNKIPVLNKNLKIRFEGGDFFFVDDSTAIIGVGTRTELEGARMIQKLLKKLNFQIVPHETFHLDMVFNIISKDLVVLDERYINKKDFPYLKDKRIISVSKEDPMTILTNFLLLKENKILADSGCHEFNKKLEKEGVEVIEVDVSELKKNGGSIRCMTLPILRK